MNIFWFDPIKIQPGREMQGASQISIQTAAKMVKNQNH